MKETEKEREEEREKKKRKRETDEDIKCVRESKYGRGEKLR